MGPLDLRGRRRRRCSSRSWRWRPRCRRCSTARRREPHGLGARPLAASSCSGSTGSPCVMALLVTGIGVVVLVYASGYFHDDPSPGRVVRFAGYFTLFAGAMLGLVVAERRLDALRVLGADLGHVVPAHRPRRRARRRPRRRAAGAARDGRRRAGDARAGSCAWRARPAPPTCRGSSRRRRRRRRPRSAWCSCSSGRSASRRSSRSTSGSRVRWSRRPRSPRSCTRRRWSRPAC